MTLTAEQKKLIERNAPSAANPFAGAAAQTKAQTQTPARTSAPVVNLTSEQKKLIADNAPTPVTTTAKRGSETTTASEPLGFLERAAKTVIGGAQQAASGHAGAIGTYTQAAGKVSEAAAKATSNSGRLRAAERNAERSRNLAASATNAQLKAQLERKADRAERKVNALTPLAVNSAQTDAIAQNLYNTSDTLAERSAENIARAKQGTGFLGGLAVDLGAQATQMLGDRLIGGVTGLGGLVPMISRSFGQGAQEARRSGASLAQQVGYGAASAAVEGITEKMFDGVAGIYGKGAADDVVANIIDRVAKNDAAKRALTIGAAAAGESAEEFASGIVNPIIRAIYNGKTVGQNYSETQLADIGYDMLVGGLLGGIGGSVQTVRDNSQRQTARNTPPVDAIARQSAAEGNLTPVRIEGAEASKNASKSVSAQSAETAWVAAPTPGNFTRRDVNNSAAFDDGKTTSYNWSAGLSEQARKAVDRIKAGEALTVEGMLAIPEVAEAARQSNGTPTIELPNREGVIQNGYNAASQRGSFSGVDAQGNDLFTGAVRQEHRMDIVLGLPGSGKSSVFTNPLSQQYGSRVIDTDDFRSYIPEYNGLNSGAVHKEATVIKNMVLNDALARGDNILLSLIGDNAAELEARIAEYNKLGYDVHLHLNELPNEKSLGRVLTRYLEGKDHRYVPLNIVAEAQNKPTETYLKLTRGGVNYGGGEESGRGGAGSARSGAVSRDAALGSPAGNGDVETARGGEAGTRIASYDWYNNDVARGQAARLIESSQQGITDDHVNPTTRTVGSAEAGFETPGSQSREQRSRLADRVLAYNRYRAEASGGLSREAYDEVFRYRSQTVDQMLQAADNLLYIETDGRRRFLMDYAPEAFAEITDELRTAPAWNGAMTKAAKMIEQELLRRSIDLEITEDVYNDWRSVMREHATETGRGVKAWDDPDNRHGQKSEAEAWEQLENNPHLTDAERRDLMRRIILWDGQIEQAESPADLKRIILEVADARGTIRNAVTQRQSRMLRAIAENALDGLTDAELREFAYQSTSALATDGTDANVGQKIKAIQILNMLSNPKTAAKNLTGNTSFYALDALAMRGAAVLDMVVSKFTGTRSVAFERSALSGEAREATLRAIRRSAAEVALDVDMGGRGRYGTSSNRTFKASGNLAERILSTIERNQGYLLTTTDEGYKGAARATSAATQQLINDKKIKNAGDRYAAERADELALYRTFQNDGKIADAIQSIHDLLNMVGIGDSGKRTRRGNVVHDFGAGDLLAPFTRVAGNLASVGVDYSPVNAAKGSVEIIDAIRRAAQQGADPARQARAVSDFARGMTGTAIAYGVMQLVENGLIRRADDEDDEDVAKLNAAEGMTGTQVNIDAAQRWADGGSASWNSGDTLIDLSNLEPINFIVSLGVAMADNGTDGLLQTFIDPAAYADTAKSALQTAGDLPILSNVGEFAKDVLVYHDNPLEAGAEMLGKTAVASVTPNVVAALAKGMDEKQRNLYTGDGVLDVLRDFLISRIPGARETLPTTTDVTGKEKANAGGQTERIINALLNPIGVNEYTQSDVSREMQRVREATGDATFYPTTRQPKTLEYTDKDGKKHTAELTYEQRQKFQQTVSAAQLSMTSAMLGSASYQRANAETQAALLKRCYDYAYQVGKSGVMGADAADSWVRNAQTAQRDIGLSAADFLAAYEKYGGGILGGSAYDKTKRMIGAGMTLDEWAAMRGSVDADGSGSTTKAEVMSYIEAHVARDKWREVFDAYKGASNWKNPY